MLKKKKWKLGVFLSTGLEHINQSMESVSDVDYRQGCYKQEVEVPK